MRLSEWPLGQLALARMREFYREPQAVFWVYGFPIIMTVALGVAFREDPEPQYRVDVTGPRAAAVVKDLKAVKTPGGKPLFLVEEQTADAALNRLRTGKTVLMVTASPDGQEYEFVPTRVLRVHELLGSSHDFVTADIEGDDLHIGTGTQKSQTGKSCIETDLADQPGLRLPDQAPEVMLLL